MPIRAEIDSKFILRFLIIGIVMVGFGFYCIYDGFFAYPKDLLKSKGFYAPAISASGETEWHPIPAEEWEKKADDNNWTREKPKKPDIIQANIYWQYGMAFMSFLVGIPILIHYFRSRNAWIEAGTDAICNNHGAKVAYKNIKRIDKSRWEKKGIAKITFLQEDKEKLFVIDDLKFLRKPTDEIMALVESKIDSSLISGAPLESELTAATTDAKPTSNDEPEAS